MLEIAQKEECSWCWKQEKIEKRFPYDQDLQKRFYHIGLLGQLLPTEDETEVIFCKKCYAAILKELEINPPWKLKQQLPGTCRY